MVKLIKCPPSPRSVLNNLMLNVIHSNSENIMCIHVIELNIKAFVLNPLAKLNMF